MSGTLNPALFIRYKNLMGIALVAFTLIGVNGCGITHSAESNSNAISTSSNPTASSSGPETSLPKDEHHDINVLQQHLIEDRGILTGVRASLRVFTEQAETGDSDSQTRLAVCYYLGIATEVDKKAARNWFEKAAESNNKKAQYALGYMLEHGEGGIKNKSEALKMYMKSAEGNDPYSDLAQREVDRMEMEIPPSEAARLKQEVIDWFNLSMSRKTKREKTQRHY